MLVVQHHITCIMLYSMLSISILSPKCLVAALQSPTFSTIRDPYDVEMTMPHPTPALYKLDVFTLCAQACLMFSKETDAIELKMILSKLQLHFTCIGEYR